jgi:dihydropteroate synthase-like protein
MSRHTLFLTGHLADKRLRAVLAGMPDPGFAWTVHDIGIQVAGLMTTDIIRRRLPKDMLGADRVVVPGHCRGDLDALGQEFARPFERGPEDLHDLPAYLGGEALAIDLSRHDVRIFAEITDAPLLSIDAILAQARDYAEDGADVIDLGCLPATPFPHMEEAIAALAAEGLVASIDSAEIEELRRGGRAGAKFLFSLSEKTLELAEETDAVPILVPAASGDLDSLHRAAERLDKAGRSYIADAVLDPIPFGFTASLLRYAELRRRLPEARILMGIGNLTELTDADTTGLNALLFGMIAELGITDVLAVQKSPHCRRAIREADRARRIMFAAASMQRLPVGIDSGLMGLRDRRPFVSSTEEIAQTAALIRDRNYRIETAADGVHIYNSEGHRTAQDVFDLYPALGVETDGGHAFYLGVQLARAEIAWQLGKRYVQDQPLDWGVATDRPKEEDLATHRAPGTTLPTRRRRKAVGS